MRALRPDRLYPLTSGLWVLDAVQPVAAVLDPDGQVRRVVSWEHLPPPPPGEPWPAPVALGDGAGLWVQHEPAGALVRVTEQGIATTAWTAGLGLAACGHGSAWCAPPPPAQELVQGADARPARELGPSLLLRVDEQGRCSRHWTPGPVRSVHAAAEALLVQVDVAGWSLHHLGAGLHEVVRPTRWMALDWHEPVPEHLTLAAHGLPEGADADHYEIEGRFDGGRRGRQLTSWYRPEDGPDPVPGRRPLRSSGLRWSLGRSAQPRPGWRPEDGAGRDLVASAHDEDGAVVARWELGQGSLRAAVPWGPGMAISVDRSPWPGRTAPGEVVLLDPGQEQVRGLFDGAAVDTTDHRWPLVARPLEVESYLAQQLATNSSLEGYWGSASPADSEAGGGVAPAALSPLAAGMREVRTAVVGQWPQAQLEWTFRFDPLPGLLLRRRVALFDEAGRILVPEHADIHLMEALDTRDLPPVTAAQDGVLDI